MLGSVTRQNVCQPEAPSTMRRLFLVAALRLHQRDQLARDERKGDEDRRQHDAGHGEDDLDVVLDAATARTSPARRTPARRSGRRSTGDTENGRSISVIRNCLPRKSYFAIAQAAATPNTTFSGTAIAAASSVSRIADSASGSHERRQVDLPALRRPRRTPRPAAAAGRAAKNISATPMTSHFTQRRIGRAPGSPRSARRAANGRG